jgi:hypothetical protein
MKKINNYWITLIELLVVISIIWILALWGSKINFNSLNDKQKIEIYSNKVISSFETIRNYSLIWKWIWVDLMSPEKWKIEFSKSWSWSVKSSYFSWWWVEYNNITFDDNYEISSIKCLKYNWNANWGLTWDIWTIEIIWTNLSLTWCVSSSKILKTTIKYKNNFEKNIEINTINWLVDSY